jgi:hypothetical protein
MPAPYDPRYAQWGPADSPAAAEQRVGFHLKMIAVLSLLLSGLSLLWVLFLFSTALAIQNEAIELPPIPEGFEDVDGFWENVSVSYMVIGGLSLVMVIGLAASGICLLARWPIARGLGILVAVLCCASLWQCFLYPFCLGLGVYSIAILFGPDARLVLNRLA